MESRELERWEVRFAAILGEKSAADPSHGLDHVRRVVANAKRLSRSEGARLDIVVPAAWLHDCVTVAKNSLDRRRASSLAAEEASEHLRRLKYPARLHDAICHAIRAHSYSAGIEPETLEARVVQDADRLDALGAIGIARCFAVGGRLALPLYDEHDPFCSARPPDDRRAVLDHFYAKLLKLPEHMQTAAGRREAAHRVGVIERFLEELRRDIPAGEWSRGG